jgi:subfamily B ATP-binding cassette protein MsbA
MLVDKCLSFGKDFYDKNTIVFLQSTLTRSTGLLEAQFHLFQKFLTNGIIVVLFLGVMFVISWFMALIALVMLMTAVFLMQGFTRRLREAATAHHRASEDFGDKVFNMLYCMPVIRSFVKEDAAREEFSKMSSIELEQAARIQKLQGLSEPVEDLVSTTAVLFIAFGLAIVMRGGAPVPATHAIIFFYLVMQLKSRLKVFTSFQMAVTAAASALVDIEHILEHDPGHIVPSGSEPFQGLRENLEFRGLSFSYEPDGAKVLDQLSFSVPARSIVAIVGPSGSGKSTLINLLMRFYDCAPGMIFVDGRDIRDYDVTSFRKRLAFVGQDVLLFNDTIHNNMVYGLEEEVSEEHLREVSRGTMLMEFIRKMPKKWQTSVGDRGGRLSGGEKQRLSIARAVIKTSDILIMDEATSALDARTEARISRYVFQAAQQKTVIIIAHRLATVRNADKIVYIEKGRVVEEGSFQELVARKGAFFEQWQLQRI